MRSFEQRIAEISRRSEEIIKKRKKWRTRILAACIQLVLCVGAWSVFALPDVRYCSTQAPDSVLNESSAKNESSAPFIEVSGAGQYRLCDDVEAVDRVLAILDPLTKQPEVIYDADSSEYAMGGVATEHYSIFLQEYHIVVTHESGTKTSYTLAGSVLTIDKTGEKTILSAEKLAELKKLLGMEGD